MIEEKRREEKRREEKRREEKRREEKRRDNSLDFLRGLAAINIIFIHTCAWTGTKYVPAEMLSVSLILDVPFFFFLSGWAFSYVRSFAKSINSLLDIYKKYVVFLIFYILLLFVVGLITNNYTGITLKNLYAHLFFRRFENTSLFGLMYAIWFMPVYFSVIPIGSYVLSKIWRKVNGDEKLYQKNCLIFLFITIMGLLYNFLGGNFFYLSRNILFYMLFYVLGMVCRNVYINKFSWVALLIILDLAAMKVLGIYLGLDISIMDNMKFPPNIIYLLYSLIFIILALWLKTKLINVSTNNVLCRVGRSAILFYFCQGISGSLLAYICPKLQMEWFIKLPIAFICNLCMCFIIVMIAQRFYKLENVLENKIKIVFKKYVLAKFN